MAIKEDLIKAIKEIVVPEIHDLKSDIKVLTSEIKRLDDKVDNGLTSLNSKIDNGLARLDSKIDTGFARLDDKMDSLRNELSSEIKRIDQKLETALDVRERIVALEAKMSSLGR